MFLVLESNSRLNGTSLAQLPKLENQESSQLQQTVTLPSSNYDLVINAQALKISRVFPSLAL